MPMNAEIVKVDAARSVECIEEAILYVVRGDKEVTVDLSALPRLDAPVLKALERLADIVEFRGAKGIVRGARVESYKVLKLMGLANRLIYEPPAGE